MSTLIKTKMASYATAIQRLVRPHGDSSDPAEDELKQEREDAKRERDERRLKYISDLKARADIERKRERERGDRMDD